MRMDAHLHAALVFAGIDPVEFIRELSKESGYTLGYGLDVARRLNAVLPVPVFTHVSINVWSGVATLFSMGGRDEGGIVEVMRIGTGMHVTLSSDRGDRPYALLEGGPRDLRRDRELDTLRAPFCGKPAWVADGIGQVQVRRGSIDLLMKEAFVEIAIEIGVDIDGEAWIAA
jgi:hypothetical protein